jgi:hypothetical protein
MRTIIDALRTGTAKERLAITADIVSILGVSFATVIGGSFALSGRIDIENLVGTFVGGLFALAGASMVVVVFLATSSWLRHKLAGNAMYFALLQFSLWSVFIGLFLIASFFSYEILSHMRFVQAT